MPPSSLDLELGLRQLASMLRAGLSLLPALRTAADQARSRRPARLWNALADRIEAGLSLSEAAATLRAFTPYVSALVRVGEQSGELDSALRRAADHLEQRRAARAILVNALIYPVLVLLLAFGVAAFMVVKVIPQVEDFLTEGHQALPPITQALLDASDALRAYAPAAFFLLLAATLAILLLRLLPAPRAALDAAALRIPVAGRLLRLSATAALARGLAILLDSGISLLDALDTAADLLSNRRLRNRVLDARSAVMQGSPLADALADAPEFLPMLHKMTAVGEATGTLANTLAETAAFHESLLLAAVRRFSALLEPVLILVVGLIVGFVYTAFFLALYSLAAPVP